MERTGVICGTRLIDGDSSLKTFNDASLNQAPFFRKSRIRLRIML
jgi:hypothetical protein